MKTITFANQKQIHISSWDDAKEPRDVREGLADLLKQEHGLELYGGVGMPSVAGGAIEFKSQDLAVTHLSYSNIAPGSNPPENFDCNLFVISGSPEPVDKLDEMISDYYRKLGYKPLGRLHSTE